MRYVLLFLFSILTFAQEFSNEITVRGCSSLYQKDDSNILMEVASVGEKRIRVDFSYSGNRPFGFHIHPDANKLFGIKDNILTHNKKNRMGQIVFSKKRNRASFNFFLKNKIKKLDHLEFNNAATRNLKFREGLIAVTSPQLKLCSWIKR